MNVNSVDQVILVLDEKCLNSFWRSLIYAQFEMFRSLLKRVIFKKHILENFSICSPSPYNVFSLILDLSYEFLSYGNRFKVLQHWRSIDAASRFCSESQGSSFVGIWFSFFKFNTAAKSAFVKLIGYTADFNSGPLAYLNMYFSWPPKACGPIFKLNFSPQWVENEFRH